MYPKSGTLPRPRRLTPVSYTTAGRPPEPDTPSLGHMGRGQAAREAGLGLSQQCLL